MTQSFNPNSLEMGMIAGTIDLQVNDGGVFNGKMGTVSGSIKAGARVKLDATSTGKLPTFVAAAVGDVAWGVIIRTPMQSSYVTGERVQVASPYRGPCVYVEAYEDLVPGTAVEWKADLTVQTKGSNAHAGYMLDYTKAGQLGRVVLSHKPA